MIKLLFFVASIFALAVALGSVFLLISAPFHWLAIGFMSYCRPRLVLGRATICFMAAWLIAAIILPAGTGTHIGILLAVFLTPWPARLWATSAAFRADDPDQRAAAAEVRNIRLESEGSQVRHTANKAWREYITDSERARLISIYQLPASFPR